MTADTHHIGEVATQVGLSLRTIRHWDEIGLVVPSGRSAGGFRLYTEADIARLLFVKTLKPLDLSLEQLGDLVTSIDAARAGRPDAGTRERLRLYRALTAARSDALRSQLRDLTALGEDLDTLTR